MTGDMPDHAPLVIAPLASAFLRHRRSYLKNHHENAYRPRHLSCRDHPAAFRTELLRLDPRFFFAILQRPVLGPDHVVHRGWIGVRGRRPVRQLLQAARLTPDFFS